MRPSWGLVFLVRVRQFEAVSSMFSSRSSLMRLRAASLTHALCMSCLDVVAFWTLGRQCGRLHRARYVIGDRNLTFNPPFSHFCLDYSTLCPPQHKRNHRHRRQRRCRSDSASDRARILRHATSSSSPCPIWVRLRERESYTRSISVLGSY